MTISSKEVDASSTLWSVKDRAFTLALLEAIPFKQHWVDFILDIIITVL